MLALSLPLAALSWISIQSVYLLNHFFTFTFLFLFLLYLISFIHSEMELCWRNLARKIVLSLRCWMLWRMSWRLSKVCIVYMMDRCEDAFYPVCSNETFKSIDLLSLVYCYIGIAKNCKGINLAYPLSTIKAQSTGNDHNIAWPGANTNVLSGILFYKPFPPPNEPTSPNSWITSFPSAIIYISS